MDEESENIYDDLTEVYKEECRRVGKRSGLLFMQSQFEYHGTWNL